MTQNISSLEPFLVKAFLARIYQKGYDRAYLVHNDPALLKKIQEKTLELIGYEIIEQNGKYCLIQSISSHIELDFDNSLRKAFIITKQMLEIAIKSCEDNNAAALEGLQMVDLEVNRLCYFCLRQINKEQHVGKEQAQQSHMLYSTIESLEHLGDDMTHLGKYLSGANRKQENKKASYVGAIKHPANTDIARMMHMLLEQFNSVYSFYYDPTTDKVNKAHRLFMELGVIIDNVGKTRISKYELMAAHIIRSASRELYYLTESKL